MPGFLDWLMGNHDNHEEQLSKKMGYGNGPGSPLYALRDEQDFQNGQAGYGGIANLSQILNQYAAKAAMAYGTGGGSLAGTPPMLTPEMLHMANGVSDSPWDSGKGHMGQIDRGGPLDRMAHSAYARPHSNAMDLFYDEPSKFSGFGQSRPSDFGPMPFEKGALSPEEQQMRDNRDAALFQQAFDGRSMEANGQPVHTPSHFAIGMNRKKQPRPPFVGIGGHSRGPVGQILLSDPPQFKNYDGGY